MKYRMKSRTVRKPIGATGQTRALTARSTVDRHDVGKWQATGWPWPRSISSGSSIAHMSLAIGQRVRNRQPDGGLIGLGTSPCSTIRWRSRSMHRVGLGDGRQQRLRVRVRRAGVDLLGRADLHQLAQVHHRHDVADVAHHRQVVGDEQVAEARAASCRSSSRLTTPAWMLTSSADTGSSSTMSDGFERQRPGDADALALATGELVREARERGRAPGRPARAARRPARRGCPATFWISQRLGDGGADRHPRVERRVRVLEHDLHLAAQLAQLARRRGRRAPGP